MDFKIANKNIIGLKISHILILIFWYVTLFPGKVHVDTGTQLQLIQNGQTTNQWTSSYFLTLQLLSFGGKTTALVSLFSLLCLYFSLTFFCRVFSQTFQYLDRALTFILFTPLFGFWGMAVNHDIFAACGAIILFSLGAELLIYKNRISIPLLIAAAFLSTFSYLTLSSALALSLFLFTKRELKKFLVISLTIFGFLFINFSGLYSTPKSATAIPMLSDIKCATESISINLSDSDWTTLSALAPREFWVTPQIGFACSQSNSLFGNIDKSNLDTREILNVWIHVVQDKPTIVFVSHLMKSREAFPPPLMQPPNNYINISGTSRDFRTLQNNSFLMTTREDSNNFPIPGISEIGKIVDFSGFVFNLRTDYLGWAGLWLLLSVLIFFFKFRSPKSLGVFLIMGSPHVMTFLIAPDVDLRYLLATCFIGYLFLADFLITKYFAVRD